MATKPTETPETTDADWRIHVGAFFDRFGDQKIGILASEDVVVQALVKDASVRQYIGLKERRDELAQMIGALVAKGFTLDAAAILDTEAERAIRHVYDSGGVLGGSSAGLACMSAKMLTGEGDFTDLGAAKTKLTERATGTASQFATVALTGRVGIAGQLLQRQTGGIALFVRLADVVGDRLQFGMPLGKLGDQLGTLLLALDKCNFSHVLPQFLKGKRKPASSALHSSSVLAVVVMLMFRPRSASTLSYSISGKMICSLTPTL